MAHEIGINETKWIEMADEKCFFVGGIFRTCSSGKLFRLVLRPNKHLSLFGKTIFGPENSPIDINYLYTTSNNRDIQQQLNETVTSWTVDQSTRPPIGYQQQVNPFHFQTGPF